MQEDHNRSILEIEGSFKRELDRQEKLKQSGARIKELQRELDTKNDMVHTAIINKIVYFVKYLQL